MPLTAAEIATWRAGTDPRVVINCDCAALVISGVTAFNGTNVVLVPDVQYGSYRPASEDADDLGADQWDA